MASFKKTYDTDSIVLRRIFAFDPDTNGRISANTLLVTGERGSASFQDTVGFLSTMGVPTSLVGGSGVTITANNSQYTVATSSIGMLQLTSSLEGLGTFRYISSSQLRSTVINLGQIYNSTILQAGNYITLTPNANKIIVSAVPPVLPTDLTSTTRGLGRLGYLSSFNTISSLNISSGSVFASFLSSQQVAASSITANKFIGDGSLLTNVPGTGSITITDLTSTTKGLGSLGYLSTLNTLGSLGYLSSFNTISSLNISSGSVFASFVSSQKITASSITANKFIGDGSLLINVPGSGAIVITELTSTTTGLGSIGYLSSLNTVSSLNISSGSITASLITATQFVGDGSLITNVPNLGVTSITSGGGINVQTDGGLVTLTITGGTAGTVVDVNLTSTVFGLAKFGYISSLALTSTVKGLGSLGYLSSFNRISSLNISSGSVFASFLSSQQITASSITANKFIGDGSMLTNLPGVGAILITDLTSTTTGLGSLGYISTITSFNSGTVYYLNYSVAGSANIGNPVNNKALQPTVTSGDSYNDQVTVSPGGDTVIRTFQTSTILPSFIPAGIWDLNLYAKTLSSYIGLYYKIYILRYNINTSTYDSIQVGTSSTINDIFPTDNTVSQTILSIQVPYTQLIAGDTIYIELHGTNSDTGSSHSFTVYYEDSVYSHLHTTFLGSVTELSTSQGLGSLGYLSSFNTISSLYISSGSIFASLLSSQQITVSSITAGTFIGIPGDALTNINIRSTVTALGTLGYLSSSAGLISTPQLTSSLVGLGKLGYISNTQLTSSLVALGTFGYLSSSAELISTPLLTSSLIGLGTFGYLSSSAELISTPQLTSSLLGLGKLGYISNTQLTSSLVALGTFGYLSSSAELISTPLLTSSLIGLGTLGYLSSAAELISTPQLISSLIGLGTLGYLSSVTDGLISTPQLTSSLIGLGTLGYLSSVTDGLISTPQLTSSLIGLGTLGYLSSSAGLISTPQLTSSLVGLGSLFYLSSFDTISSVNISSGTIYTSTTSTSEITAGRVNFGSLYVNNIPIVFDQFGNLSMSFQTL